MVAIDVVTAEVEGVVVDIIVVAVLEGVVFDAVMVVVEFNFLDNPEGSIFDDLFEEAVSVSLEVGASFEVVSFTYNISVLASVVVS